MYLLTRSVISDDDWWVLDSMSFRETFLSANFLSDSWETNNGLGNLRSCFVQIGSTKRRVKIKSINMEHEVVQHYNIA